nr:MAG TPA: hypothetical protein [Bacteriophage sp.]
MLVSSFIYYIYENHIVCILTKKLCTLYTYITTYVYFYQ